MRGRVGGEGGVALVCERFRTHPAAGSTDSTWNETVIHAVVVPTLSSLHSLEEESLSCQITALGQQWDQVSCDIKAQLGCSTLTKVTH